MNEEEQSKLKQDLEFIIAQNPFYKAVRNGMLIPEREGSHSRGHKDAVSPKERKRLRKQSRRHSGKK